MKRRRSGRGTTWRSTKRRRRQSTEPIKISPGATVHLAHNECWARVVDVSEHAVITAISRSMRFRPEGYNFMPKFKSGRWDGWISLYQKGSRIFPGGLLHRVDSHLTDLGVVVTVDDRSQSPLKEPLLAGGINSTDLRDYQLDAVTRAIAAKRGVFDAATGLGKTEIMGEMIRRLETRALIIVASRDLAWQTIERFQGTLTFPNSAQEGLYGIVGDDVYQPSLITVAMYQTLHRRLEEEPDETREWLASFDSLHLDECHRAPATTWWPIINACPAYWRFGYSATPFKSDIITELKLVGATGEIFYSFKAKDAVEAGWLTEPVVTIVTPDFPLVGDEEGSYIDAYRDDLVEHEKRNRLIADIAAGTSDGWGTPTLILVQWIEHGKNIRRALRQLDLKVDFISGSASTAERRAALKALGDGTIKCLISTTIFDEGVNVPEIGALILAGGGKARHRVIQRIGRGLRVVPGKEYLAVFDFWDDHSPRHLLGHSRQRLRAVKDAGFTHQELTVKQTLARIKKGDVRPSRSTGR